MTATPALGYDVVGTGIPLLALHGAYSTADEVRRFVEPVVADRAVKRIYADLPGHGRSRGLDIRTPGGVLDACDAVLAAEAPEGPILLVGHSVGGHFARAWAARCPERVAGLALICPMVAGQQVVAAGEVVRDDGVSSHLEPDQREEFEGYFVVRTAATLEAFREGVLPSIGPVDDDVLDDVLVADSLVGDQAVTAPVLVASGRRDAWVGWERQEALARTYPRGTAITVADAGHALPHEKPELMSALLGDWLARAGVGAGA